MRKPANPQPPIDLLRQRIHSHLSDLTGREDLQGLEIAGLIRRLANAYDICHERHMAECDLSGPRLGLLMRLEWEERRGNQDGVRPTDLSLNQRVSRNTISALLSGLEERGLIERRLDSQDRRAFRIRLTDRGRQIVSEHAPRLIEHHNRLAAALTPVEQNQLIDLLARLYAGLTAEQSAAHPAAEAVE
jgi:DNA-binding MarR family transcriptional regulator